MLCGDRVGVHTDWSAAYQNLMRFLFKPVVLKLLKSKEAHTATQFLSIVKKKNVRCKSIIALIFSLLNCIFSYFHLPYFHMSTQATLPHNLRILNSWKESFCFLVPVL